MLLAVLVIQQCLFPQALLQGLSCDSEGAVRGDLAVQHGHLQRVQRRAGVPVGKGSNGGEEILLHADSAVAESPFIGKRMGEHGCQVGRCQRLQYEHLAPGQQGGIDFKGGVLRGGSDQSDAALLHIGEEGVLLGLVEPVYLVHEAEGAGAVGTVLLRLLHDLFDFLDAAGDGAEIHEARPGAARDDPGQGGLAHAGRPPEYHGRHDVLLQHLPQDLTLSQQMLLADIILQVPGAHPVRQGRVGRCAGRGRCLPCHIKKRKLFHGSSYALLLPFRLQSRWLDIVRGIWYLLCRPAKALPVFKVSHLPTKSKNRCSKKDR